MVCESKSVPQPGPEEVNVTAAVTELQTVGGITDITTTTVDPLVELSSVEGVATSDLTALETEVVAAAVDQQERRRRRAAPAFAAAIALLATCLALRGTCGLRSCVLPDPVKAQVMKTSRFIVSGIVVSCGMWRSLGLKAYSAVQRVYFAL